MRAALAVIVAGSIAFAPLAAGASITRGLSEATEVIPGTLDPNPQVVTSGGWYDATDMDDPDSITLANMETDESLSLPAGSNLIGVTDSWLAWSSSGGSIRVRDAETGVVRSLGVEYADQETLIDGDRLVMAVPASEAHEAAIVSVAMADSESVSTPFSDSGIGIGLAADGDWAVWAEAVGEGPDSWDVRAWNMRTGEAFAIAEGIHVLEDEYLGDSLRVSGTHVLWVAADGAHAYDLDTRSERVVATDPREVVLSGDWAVWTATPPGGTAGVDDVFALDLSVAADAARVTTVTATLVGETDLRGSDGWAIFVTPDAAMIADVVNAVDLATLVTFQVSAPGDSVYTLAGIDGQRVSWVTQWLDEGGNESFTLWTRVLGLPGPQLKDRYASTTSSCVVTWTPIPAADYYRYQVGAGAIESTTGTAVQVDGLVSGEPVPVTVWAVRGDVTSEPQSTFAVRFGALSKISIVPKATTVNLDSTASFTVKLQSGTTLLAAKPVLLEYSANGKTGWSEVIDSEKATGSKGTAVLASLATRTLYYRAVFDGDVGHSAAYSPVVKVAAKAVVGTPGFPSTVRKSRKTTASGALRPAGFVHATNSVTVYAYHLEGSKWVLRAKATAAVAYSAETGTSSYRAGLTMTRTGKWRLKASYAGSTIAAANSSSYRYFTVK